jgi:hypothetical protein
MGEKRTGQRTITKSVREERENERERERDSVSKKERERQRGTSIVAHRVVVMVWHRGKQVKTTEKEETIQGETYHRNIGSQVHTARSSGKGMKHLRVLFIPVRLR